MVNQLTQYMKDTYKAKVEHPWPKYPMDTTFKDPDTDKWFALIMDVRKTSLGDYGKRAVSKEDIITVINVKLNEDYIITLSDQPGFMSR